MNNKFDVFLSFSGDIRNNINDIQFKLTTVKIKPFYDNNHKDEIAGEDTDIKLNEYIKNSSFFVPFISIKYNKKFWPKKEMQYARSIKNKKYGFIVPIIIGETDEEKIQDILNEIGIPGVTGYIPYKELSEDNITDIVDVLSKKVKALKKKWSCRE